MTTTSTLDTAGIEQALLGTLLLRPELWEQTSTLTVEDFNLTAHKTIFARAAAVREEGMTPDAELVLHELARHGELDRVGGAGLLSDMIRDRAFCRDVRGYACAIQQAARLRRLGELGEWLQEAVGKPGADSEEIGNLMMKKLTEVRA